MGEKVTPVGIAAFVPVHHKSRGNGNVLAFETFKNKILQRLIFVCVRLCEICADDYMDFRCNRSCQIDVVQDFGKGVVAPSSEFDFVMRFLHPVKRDLHLGYFHSLQSSYVWFVQVESRGNDVRLERDIFQTSFY